MALRQVGFDPGCRCWIVKQTADRVPVVTAVTVVCSNVWDLYLSDIYFPIGMIECMQVNFDNRDVNAYVINRHIMIV